MRLYSLFLAPALLLAETKVIPLDSIKGMRLVNVIAEPTTYKGKMALKVVEPPTNKVDREDKMIVLPLEFEKATIELDLAGAVAKDAMAGARGFVGVAFRVAADLKKFECIYLRPTNPRSDDQVRRNHSAQYISFPDYPWQRLRKEEPEKYESYVDLIPGEWTKVKIVVAGTKATLFVHGNEQPTLIINDLKKGESKGALALWIGPGTEAHFANLKVTLQ